MNRTSKRKAKQPFSSKADTKELREYQRLASQYPPLDHEEILGLSRRFNAGRNMAVALDEHTVVDAVLDGDWSDENVWERKDDVISAYGRQIDWLGMPLAPGEYLHNVLPADNPTVSGLYEARGCNVFADMPWVEPLSLVTVCPKAADMSLDEFIAHESELVEKTVEAIGQVCPRHTPKDVVDTWKRRKTELSRHYMTTVRSLEKSPMELRRARMLISDSERALAAMVNHNLQLAMSRVGKIMENNQRAKTIGVFELIGAANVGLVLGARQFDPELGKKFSTYAAYHIDGQLYELLNREDGKSGIKGMSLHEQKQLASILTIRSTFEKLYDATPTITELQSLTGISSDIIRKRLTTPQVHTQNIYAPVSREDDSNGSPTVLADTLASNTDVETAMEQDDYQKMLEVLKAEIARLDDAERYIVMARTGIAADNLIENTAPPKTPRKIAAETGLTMSQVNDCYQKALTKLRQKLELYGWSVDTVFPED